MKELISTQAKLPKKEMRVGSDACTSCAKNNLKKINSEYKKFLKNGK